jgi:hypothetical protein
MPERSDHLEIFVARFGRQLHISRSTLSNLLQTVKSVMLGPPALEPTAPDGPPSDPLLSDPLPSDELALDPLMSGVLLAIGKPSIEPKVGAGIRATSR